MCAARDLGRSVGDRSAGTAIPLSAELPGQQRRRLDDFDPTVFFYDNMPGGVGLAKELHKRFDVILDKATDMLKGCKCGGTGCPTCLGSMLAYDGTARAAAIGLADALASEARP